MKLLNAFLSSVLVASVSADLPQVWKVTSIAGALNGAGQLEVTVDHGPGTPGGPDNRFVRFFKTCQHGKSTLDNPEFLANYGDDAGGTSLQELSSQNWLDPVPDDNDIPPAIGGTTTMKFKVQPGIIGKAGVWTPGSPPVAEFCIFFALGEQVNNGNVLGPPFGHLDDLFFGFMELKVKMKFKTDGSFVVNSIETQAMKPVDAWVDKKYTAAALDCSSPVTIKPGMPGCIQVCPTDTAFAYVSDITKLILSAQSVPPATATVPDFDIFATSLGPTPSSIACDDPAAPGTTDVEWGASGYPGGKIPTGCCQITYMLPFQYFPTAEPGTFLFKVAPGNGNSNLVIKSRRLNEGEGDERALQEIGDTVEGEVSGQWMKELGPADEESSVMSTVAKGGVVAAVAAGAALL